MRDLKESIAIGIFERGPQTLTNFIRGKFKVGNQISVQKVLKEMETEELLLQRLPVSNWAELPGNARPYCLTRGGKRWAAYLKTKRTGKLVVESDAFEEEATRWKGVAFDTAVRYYAMDFFNSPLRPGMTQEQLKQWSEKLEQAGEIKHYDSGTIKAWTFKDWRELHAPTIQLPPAWF